MIIIYDKLVLHEKCVLKERRVPSYHGWVGLYGARHHRYPLGAKDPNPFGTTVVDHNGRRS